MRSSVLTGPPEVVSLLDCSDSPRSRLATHYATVYLDTVTSTQDEALRRAGPSGQPTLVIAQRQVAGRGRTGRLWLEAPRAMYSSLAWRPSWPVDQRSRLTLITGLAVRRALADLAGLRPDLKWPNDLVTPAGKLGGILTEAMGDWVVIGCGVNLWWPDSPPGVAAACASDPGAALAESVGRRWASEVLDVAAGRPHAWDVAAYRAACVTIGTAIEWEPNGEGVAVDVAVDGALIVDTPQGRRAITSGEVRTVRAATVAADQDGEREDTAH